MRRVVILAAIALCALAGCKNPLYWVLPARKLFVSVTSARRIYELDRSGLRSTWAQIDVGSGPTRLAYSATRDALYALAPEAKELVEASPHSYQIQNRHGTQGRSTDLAISGDGRWAYALNPDERTAVRVDLVARRVERSISFADGDFAPAALAAHPSAQDDIYVVSASGSVVVVRDGAKGTQFPLGTVVRAARVVPGRGGDLYVVDAGGTTLHRLTEPDASKVTAFSLLLAGGSAVAGTDGSVYVSAPDAHKVVRITAQGERSTFDVGGQVPRAIVADEAGIYIANEGSNQVVAMTLSGGRLREAQVVDTLPGPPADMVVVGN